MSSSLLVADDRFDSLIDVLDGIRDDVAHTRSGLTGSLGLGRAVVAQRVGQLLEWGLIEEADLAPSTGGRSARELHFRADAGRVLTANLNAGRIIVGLNALDGRPVVVRDEPNRIADGPAPTLERLAQLFDEVLASQEPGTPPLWAIGVGVPGPVDYATGRPLAPPIMPGWDGFPIREWLSQRYDVPVWVDNDTNLMMLGELRAGLARGERDVILVKVSAGIGSALVCGGRLHRGAQGVAGDIGHVVIVDDRDVVCRCGQTGCLEAVAGGEALGRQATAAAREGRSTMLMGLLDETQGELEPKDVLWAASHGDPVAVHLLTASSHQVGATLASLVSFFNPALVVIGGGLPEAGDFYLAGLRQTVYSRSLPLATRDLRIVRSALGDEAGLRGAAFVATDELLSKQCLPSWIHRGSPAGMPDLPALSQDPSHRR